MTIVVTCTCGRQFKVKDELAGKRGKCAACGRILTVPAAASMAAEGKQRPAGPRACPTCGEPLRAEAVLCVSCGFDLRTGKKLAPAKPSPSVAPSGESESVAERASTPRPRMALIAGGASLLVVAGAVLLLWKPWAGKPTGVAKANAPIPSAIPTGTALDAVGTQPANGAANPAKPATAGLTPEPKPPNDRQGELVVKKLLARVAAISDDNVRAYKKMLAGKQVLDVFLFEGTLPNARAEVDEVRKLGREKDAVAALAQLIRNNRASPDKKALIVCGQAIAALGQLGLAARETLPLVAELANHPEVAVASKAKGAAERIQDEIEGAQLQTADPAAYQDRLKLQGEWKPVSFEATGVGARKPDPSAGVFFDGGKLSISVPGMYGRMSYRLHPGKRPKEIDLTGGKENDRLYGIYDLQGDTLSLCVGKAGRPRAMRIQNEKFAILLVLKKRTPAAPPPGPVPGKSPAAAPKTAQGPKGVALLNAKFIDEMSIRRRIDPLAPEQDLRISAEPGRRLLWTEFKLTRPGLTTIDLTKLRAEDGARRQYRPAAFKVGLRRAKAGRLQDGGVCPFSTILRKAGLKGSVIPIFSGGTTSTEYATAKIDVSVQAIKVNLKSGEVFVSFVFVVPAGAARLTIRDFAGGDVALGALGGP